MHNRTAVVLGATGLIGQILVEKLLQDNSFKTVRILVRRKTNFSHQKLEEEIVDFNDLEDYKRKMGKGDITFCCVGTTQQKVKGNKEEYKKVDFDIPVHGAEIAYENNFSQFLMISSVGAEAKSRNFYLSLKGKTENAIQKMGLESIWFLRPSLLLGKRKESRFGERIAQYLMPVFSHLLIGKMRKYRAIEAADVAAALIQFSKKNSKGVHFPEYTEIMKAAEEYH